MQNAELYVRSNHLQFTEAKSFLDLCKASGYIKKSVKENERVLDVGCGPGDVTKTLLHPALQPQTQLIGIDLSYEMVNYANEHYANENIAFQQANIEDPLLLPKLNIGKFDKIFSFHCLQWIKNQRLAFCNLSKLLKPGGTIYLVFIANSKMNDLNHKLSVHPRWKYYLKVLEEYNPELNIAGDIEEYYCGILKDLNFSVSECRLVESEHTFTNMQHLSDILKVLHPSVKNMSNETMALFMQDIQRIILEENLAHVNPGTGKITAAHHIFRIVATKT